MKVARLSSAHLLFFFCLETSKLVGKVCLGPTSSVLVRQQSTLKKTKKILWLMKFRRKVDEKTQHFTEFAISMVNWREYHIELNFHTSIYITHGCLFTASSSKSLRRDGSEANFLQIQETSAVFIWYLAATQLWYSLPSDTSATILCIIAGVSYLLVRVVLHDMSLTAWAVR